MSHPVPTFSFDVSGVPGCITGAIQAVNLALTDARLGVVTCSILPDDGHSTVNLFIPPTKTAQEVEEIIRIVRRIIMAQPGVG